MKTLSVFAALLFVVFSAPVLAQLTAQLTGTVLDASGAAITGASVRLVNVDTNFTWDATSNTSGSFAFPVLQPGEYRLTVEASGFRTTTRSNIRLEVAQTARVDFSLEVGGSTQSVDVVAEAELLDSGISSIGQVVGSNSVSNLPTNGRNSYGFITLVPGVRAPGGFQLPQIDNVSSAFVSINGARNDDLVEEATDLATLTRRYTDETIRFIREHSDQPFFVYLCPNMPHTVLAASDEFRGRSPRGLYGDVVEELDYNTGRILDTLRELKLDQNTYVLFTSDNVTSANV